MYNNKNFKIMFRVPGNLKKINGFIEKSLKVFIRIFEIIKKFTLKFNDIEQKQKVTWLLVAVLILSTVFKFIYVFYLSDYKDYLGTDMGAYWDRTTERFNGEIFNIGQWSIWPPLYHLLLFNVFKVISFVGLYSHKLEIVLSLHILLCSLSVYYLYKISLAILKNYWASWLIATTYAFSFIMIYFKAFILSENAAIPLVIISIWFLFKNNRTGLIISGILLAIATGIRPGYGLLGLSFTLYVFLCNKQWKHKILRSLVFIISFCSVIFLILSEINYISQGRLKGLSASSGLTFYLSFTQAHGIKSTADGMVYIIYPPKTCEDPENGMLFTSKPFADTKYYINLGIQHIKKHPSVLFKKLSDIKELFFGVFMPWVGSAKWFETLRVPSQWYMFVMFLLSLLVWICYKDSNLDRIKFLLLISVVVLGLLVNYFFNTEHRYLYSFAFVLHFTFIATLFEIIRNFKRYRLLLIIYCSTVTLIVAGLAFFSSTNVKPINLTLKTIVSQNADPIKDLNQERKITKKDSILINYIEYNPEENRMIHKKLEMLGYYNNFFMDTYADFKVLKPGKYEFVIVSKSGFELELDKRILISFPYETNDRSDLIADSYLEKGHHKLKIKYFRGVSLTGIDVFYKPLSDPASLQYLVGVNTEYINFVDLKNLKGYN